jgi:hypothetical protein
MAKNGAMTRFCAAVTLASALLVLATGNDTRHPFFGSLRRFRGQLGTNSGTCGQTHRCGSRFLGWRAVSASQSRFRVSELPNPTSSNLEKLEKGETP